MKSDSLVGCLANYNLEYILIGSHHRTLQPILFPILLKEIVCVTHSLWIFGKGNLDVLNAYICKTDRY